MDNRFYYISAFLLMGIVLGFSFATASLGEESSFPDSNSEFVINDSENYLYGEKTSVNSTEFLVYGPYEYKGENYTVVKNLENGNEKVYSNGSSLEIKEKILGADDRIKGVKSLYIETSLDPLLYSGYSNDLEPEKFSDYGERILTSGPHEWTNQSERNLIYEEGLEGNNLLAHRFLESLTDVRDSTVKFYETPSYENSKSLISSYETSQRNYQKDLQDQIEIYENLADRRSGGQRETWVTQSGKTISFQTILDDLGKVNQNSKALKDEIERRKKILRNNENPDIQRSGSGFNGTTEFREEIENYYNKEELEEVYRKRLDVGQKLVESEEIGGPYEVKVSCLEENHLVTRADDPRSYPNYMVSDSVARRINYTDRKYYSEGFPSVRSEGEGETFSPEGFNNTGKLAESDMVFTYCPCPYYDRTGLHWELIDKTYKNIGESPILQSIDEEEVKSELEGYEERERVIELIESGKKAERMFMDYPSQRRVEILGDYYKNIYREAYLASEKGYSVSAVENKSEVLQDTFSLIKGKIGAIQRPIKKNYLTDNGARGYMYTEAMDYDTINESNFNEIFDEMDVLRHSVTRLTLLPDSETVWRTDEEMDYYSEEERLPLWTTYRP